MLSLWCIRHNWYAYLLRTCIVFVRWLYIIIKPRLTYLLYLLSYRIRRGLQLVWHLYTSIWKLVKKKKKSIWKLVKCYNFSLLSPPCMCYHAGWVLCHAHVHFMKTQHMCMYVCVCVSHTFASLSPTRLLIFSLDNLFIVNMFIFSLDNLFIVNTPLRFPCGRVGNHW